MHAHLNHEQMSRLLGEVVEAQCLPLLLHDQHRVLLANAAARQLLGAETLAAIEGVSLDVFLVPELADVVAKRRSLFLGSEMVFTNMPIMLRTLDGRTLHLRVDARPINVGDTTVGMVTVTR